MPLATLGTPARPTFVDLLLSELQTNPEVREIIAQIAIDAFGAQLIILAHALTSAQPQENVDGPDER
jgi:hypothetical protein